MTRDLDRLIFDLRALHDDIRLISAELIAVAEWVRWRYGCRAYGKHFCCPPALSAEKEKMVDALILWAPILKGNDYLQQLLRMNLTHQVVVYKKILYTREELVKGVKEGKKINVEGYEISKELYEQVSRIDLLAEEKNFSGKTGLFQFSQNLAENDPYLEKLKVLYSKNSIPEILITSAPPFWGDMNYYPPETANLFEKTLGWLKSNL